MLEGAQIFDALALELMFIFTLLKGFQISPFEVGIFRARKKVIWMKKFHLDDIIENHGRADRDIF